MLFKKSHIRALAVVAESHRDGGAPSTVLAPYILQQFGKVCQPEVLESILTHLSIADLVAKDLNTGNWICTKLGLLRYEAIKANQPHLLEKTTSPQLETHT